MAQLLSIATFVKELEAALNRKDGYIMGSRGQNPRTGSLDLSVTKESSSWKTTGWYYTQYKDRKEYTAEQEQKALYWREHATRVWDCNGMAEGIYELHTGININARARNNYNEWCNPKGTGIVPASMRKPGVAVFWGPSASGITHVAYLWKPVVENKPEGDWYLIEAQGVLKGVVSSKLLSRKPGYWGYMTKYFDYENAIPEPYPANSIHIGMEGAEVKKLQQDLMAAGEKLPKYKDDGDFGQETLAAVKSFQKKHSLPETGIVDDATKEMLAKVLNAEVTKMVEVTGGRVNVRKGPSVAYTAIGVAKQGEKYSYNNETYNEWYCIVYKGQKAWISGKYSKLLT